MFRRQKAVPLSSTSARTRVKQGSEQLMKYKMQMQLNYCRFVVGDEVRVEVDALKRQLHARLHSAGHLMDSALANIGAVDLIPAKVC